MVKKSECEKTKQIKLCYCCSGDAFLEPYMQGLSNDDVAHTNVDDVLNDNCTALKKRLLDEYPTVNDDRTSSFSSPVNSLDTPLDDKVESQFRLIEVHAESQGSLTQVSFLITYMSKFSIGN